MSLTNISILIESILNLSFKIIKYFYSNFDLLLFLKIIVFAVCICISINFILISFDKITLSIRKGSTRSHILKLMNNGNVRQFYLLRLLETPPDMFVTLWFRGIPLIKVTKEIEISPAKEEIITENNAQTQENTVQSANNSQMVPNLNNPFKTDNIRRTQNKLKETGQRLGILSSFLSALSSLLPSNLKKKISGIQEGTQELQKNIASAARLPDTVTSRVENLKKQSERLLVSAPSNVSPSSKNKIEAKQKFSSTQDNSIAESKQNNRNIETEKIVYYRTPVLEPGKSFDLEIQFLRKKPLYEIESYHYALESRGYSADKRDVHIDPVTIHGTVVAEPTTHIQVIRPYLRFAAVAGIAIIILISIGMLLF